MIAGQLSPGRNWPLAPISKPVGVCIQLLTDSIQKAEMKVPIATAQVAAKCRPLPTLLMPNSMTTRKDRKSVVEGKSVAVRVDPGGRRTIKKKNQNKNNNNNN